MNTWGAIFVVVDGCKINDPLFCLPGGLGLFETDKRLIKTEKSFHSV